MTRKTSDLVVPVASASALIDSGFEALARLRSKLAAQAAAGAL